MSLRTRITQLRQWHHCHSLNTQHSVVRLPYILWYGHTRRSLYTSNNASSNSVITSPISRCISSNTDKPQHKRLYGWGQGIYGLKQVNALAKPQLSTPVHLTELENTMDMVCQLLCYHITTTIVMISNYRMNH
jgi:hypothetical protein